MAFFMNAAPDRYVRVTLSQLRSANLHQLESALDPSIAVPEEIASSPDGLITGFSEWAGSYGKSNLSIGWDWGLVGGSLVVLNPAEIRTNILLINDQGYDESRLFTRMQLLQLIESLPWRDDAMKMILAGGHKP